MNGDARPALLASKPPHGRAGEPRRAPMGWLARQAYLFAVARHTARLRALADRIEAIATKAARRREIVTGEAEALDAVAASLRVRAVHIRTFAHALFANDGGAGTRNRSGAIARAGTDGGAQ